MSQTSAEKIKGNSIYPRIKQVDFNTFENAVCEFKVSLPTSVKDQILSFSKQITPELTKGREKNFSVLNCYDFHYSSDKLKLIEANTNASGFLISNLMEEDENKIKDFEEVLSKSFIKSFGEKPKKIFINDEDPDAEKMIVEFLMYQDFFKRFDIETEIIKTKDLAGILEKTPTNEKVFCYNRDCDFYLDKNPKLKKAWLDDRLILSAHPEAYSQIASKKVLLNPELLNKSDVFLETVKINQETAESLWQRRKSFFFKPMESYGSKGVYAGKSVSKKKFQEIIETGGYIAQELHLPGKLMANDQEWKFDIRAFFSLDETEKIVARVYRGQVTNFKNPGGGFALIDWLD